MDEHRNIEKGIMEHWNIGKMGKKQKTQTQDSIIPAFPFFFEICVI